MNNVDFPKIITENMKDYAEEVNFHRSIIDISGLKTVQLRILYTMYDMKLLPNKPHGKCAEIVANTMAHLHPHGDSAIYDALVRLSQWWTLNYPLVEFNGNNGTPDGDPAAAYRYTSARLTTYGVAMVEDIFFNTVPFVDNYLETGKEPAYTMSFFPNCFLNISKGIGVGAACNTIPFRLDDIIEAIKTEDVSSLIPSFPTGGVIANPRDLQKIYATGKGDIVLRGKYKMEDKGVKFYEFPYQVSRTEVVDQCKSLGLKAYDTSTISEQSIFIETKDVEKLFASTKLESRFSVNLTIQDQVKVKPYSLLQLIQLYKESQFTRLTKKHDCLAQQAKAKIHIQEGLLKALQNIDKVIQLIRQSATPGIANESLQQMLGIDKEQASAILAITLSRLTHLGIKDIEDQLADLQEQYERAILIRDNRDRQEQVLYEEELPSIRKLGIKRTTVEDVKVVVTAKGEAPVGDYWFFRHMDGESYDAVVDGEMANPASVGFNSKESYIIITSKLRGFLRKGDAFSLGESNDFQSIVALTPGEKVMLVFDPNDSWDGYLEFTSGGQTYAISHTFVKQRSTLRGRKLTAKSFVVDKCWLNSTMKTEATRVF